jgi:glyoxylase-like metal-dependent hydrolase (beta-lactamase superfamily II)
VSSWLEVGDRVFVRRYRFADQGIGAVVGDDGVLVIDTRSTYGQARDVLRDLREITPLPVRAVVNTHFHYDHTWGNRVFRPAPIWGHARCATTLLATEARVRASLASELPGLAGELAEVEIDPPDQLFEERATLDAGGRPIELRHVGRGHTDHDIIARVRDANVVFAGDLLENGAPPWFGDGYPLDWPGTADALVALVDGAVVPGHGAVGYRPFAVSQAADLRALADLARAVHAGEVGLEDAVRRAPYPVAATRDALDRALAQLRGELD